MTARWFTKMSPSARQEYLSKHPRSKMRGKTGASKSKVRLRLKTSKMKLRSMRKAREDEGSSGNGVF